jgi:mono/diheme cytochrome c family protein
MLKLFFCCTLLLLTSTLILVASSPQQPAPAPSPPTAIPAEAARMVNPVKPTPESLAHAKKIYGYDCAICHGATGDGKGDAVADLKLKMRDYTDPAALKDLTDGEIFYIIRNGKGQMPSEEVGRAKNEDVWNMVVMVRSFAKK